MARGVRVVSLRLSREQGGYVGLQAVVEVQRCRPALIASASLDLMPAQVTLLAAVTLPSSGGGDELYPEAL